MNKYAQSSCNEMLAPVELVWLSTPNQLINPIQVNLTIRVPVYWCCVVGAVHYFYLPPHCLRLELQEFWQYVIMAQVDLFDYKHLNSFTHYQRGATFAIAIQY